MKPEMGHWGLRPAYRRGAAQSDAVKWSQFLQVGFQSKEGKSHPAHIPDLSALFCYLTENSIMMQDMRKKFNKMVFLNVL